MQKSAWLVFNPIMVDNFASLFICTMVSWASDLVIYFFLILFQKVGA